jgi:hypothetical protein
LGENAPNLVTLLLHIRDATCLLQKLRGTGGRCYDHNCLRFSTIFGGKIGVFLKNECFDQIFAKKLFDSLRKKGHRAQHVSLILVEKDSLNRPSWVSLILVEKDSLNWPSRVMNCLTVVKRFDGILIRRRSLPHEKNGGCVFAGRCGVNSATFEKVVPGFLFCFC